MNNRRPIVKDWVRLGEESFSGSQAQCVMKASGHIECVARGQKILQYRQFIFLPFLTGTCINIFFRSSPQLCLYGGGLYLLLDKNHIPLLLASWVAASQVN